MFPGTGAVRHVLLAPFVDTHDPVTNVLVKDLQNLLVGRLREQLAE